MSSIQLTKKSYLDQYRLPVRLRLVGFALILLAFSTVASTQTEFPTKPITVVVTTPPGGTDQMVRMLSDSVQAQIGQPLVVVNRVGVNGVIAINSVMSAQADGHTILFASMSAMTMNPFVYNTAKYNAAEDLIPIAQHAVYPMMWIASKKSGITSMADMLRYAKQNPDKFFVGNIGEGGMAALVQRLYFDKHGIKPTYVPYAGNPQTVMALQSNDIQISVEPYLLALQQARQGLYTPLATTSAERNKTMPDLPTVKEAGMDFGLDAWFGFFAPKGTSQAVILKLNTAINKALQEPRIKQYFEEGGGAIRPLDPISFSKVVADDHKRFSSLVPSSGLLPK
jgi:tripartite-type tricarboxylate transporter receptor subunit TctC